MSNPHRHNSTQDTYKSLKEEIARVYSRLPKRQRQIANFIAQETEFAAAAPIANVAERAGVHASAFIRFAKQFGFHGFSDLQRVLRTQYNLARTRRSHISRAGGNHTDVDIAKMLEQLVVANMRSIARLVKSGCASDLALAATQLGNAGIIGVTAQGGGYSTAAYLAHALDHLGLRVVLLDGSGNCGRDQVSILTDRDVLVAIAIPPYGHETPTIAALAKSQGAAIVAITDRGLNPLIPLADIRFEVEEASLNGVASPVAAICLSMGLVLAIKRYFETVSVRRTGAWAIAPPAATEAAR